MTEWNAIAEQIPKLRKKYEVGASTIDAVIDNLLAHSDFKYHRYTENGDTYLMIQMDIAVAWSLNYCPP